MHILAVIPARGGSKGIPRKNLRLLNGKPLIYYAITNALRSRYITDVYVSSDDDEILYLAETFGAKVHKRDPKIADDQTTLDPVIYDTFDYAQKREKKRYDIVVTMQPTSPLLQTESVDDAIERMLESDIETIISVKDATHLSWRKEGDRYLPNYTERVNRQYLTPTFTETGGFLITRTITPASRIGSRVDLYPLAPRESIDIDTYEDWNLCEYYLRQKHLLFVVTGHQQVGLGHVYNTLILANDILNHRITFLVDKHSQLAYEKIASHNYPVVMQSQEDIVSDIARIAPDVVINDRLDTDEAYIRSIQSLGCRVINFEDLGTGAKVADLVINAIYPEKEILPKHYFGHRYFVLRDEFIYTPPKEVAPEVKRVLVTFGGVDPNNLTHKVIDAIYSYTQAHGITIEVVAGFGYERYDTLAAYSDIVIYRNVAHIAKLMQQSDLIFTSAGRTIYEVAAMRTPAIVLAQNEREMTHLFASEEHGFMHLGLGAEVIPESIVSAFAGLAEDHDRRKQMSQKMDAVDLHSGRERVIELIQTDIKEHR